MNSKKGKVSILLAMSLVLSMPLIGCSGNSDNQQPSKAKIATIDGVDYYQLTIPGYDKLYEARDASSGCLMSASSTPHRVGKANVGGSVLAVSKTVPEGAKDANIWPGNGQDSVSPADLDTKARNTLTVNEYQTFQKLLNKVEAGK